MTKLRSGAALLVGTVLVLLAGNPAPAFGSPPFLARRSVLGAGVAPDPGGVEIVSVTAVSPAFLAGLRVNDVITDIGGVHIADPAQFVATVRHEPLGRPIPFAMVRDGQAIRVPVVFTPAPVEHDPEVNTYYGAVAVDGSLRRTLTTVPKHTTGRHPAVLLVGGIGCYSVDNAADGNDSYMRLAHDLGRRGIVVMRLEKSGVGDSQGPQCETVDLDSEIRSYSRALDALRSDPSVEPGHVYLFGHSIGTLIAPRLANESRVAGIIVAEAVGRNWIEYELLNLRRQLALDGTTPADIDDAMRGKELCMHKLLIERQPRSEIDKADPSCKVHILYPVADAYMQQAAAINIAGLWAKIDVPVLAVYGTADYVTDLDDHRRIVAIVNGSHPGEASLEMVTGMDHHLDQAGTPQEAWDRRVKQRQILSYSDRFSAVVGDWLCAHERCAQPGPARS